MEMVLPPHAFAAVNDGPRDPRLHPPRKHAEATHPAWHPAGVRTTRLPPLTSGGSAVRNNPSWRVGSRALPDDETAELQRADQDQAKPHA